MKLFANKKLFKKIVILLVTITLVNALIPLHMVSADADEDYGGKLFKPIFKFIAGIGDLFVRALQNIFMGTGKIYSSVLGDKPYQIRYSPGVIFSNKVPGLDANFIKPGDSIQLTVLPDQLVYTAGTEKISFDDPILEGTGFDPDTIEMTTTLIGNFYHCEYNWAGPDGGYYRLKTQYREGHDPNNPDSVEQTTAKYDTKEDFFKSPVWVFESTEKQYGESKESTAAQLQVTVSKWYKALRLVSLVALLSVLVYVGIRIIISSTGQEKAKYKKMIGDWVAAICILFVLNYIMAFTMDIVNKIIEVFAPSIEANGADTLMSTIRNNINSDQYSDLPTFTNLILYIVLIVYTVIFTIHYLKRVVYLAFFTMIAPLIAVTYPIDRIKDGQAQAFGTWIKEYTFNAAIPVIHIIIYSALVGSAPELAESNPLYAIVCISFLIPAEKFFKKLFGFEKANTVGQLGAAAGGALIMNAINKMGAKSGKQAAAKAGAGASSTPRGLSANAMQIASGNGGTAGPGGAGSSGAGSSGAGGAGPTGGASSGGAGSSGAGGTSGLGSTGGTGGSNGTAGPGGAGGPGGTGSGYTGGAGTAGGTGSGGFSGTGRTATKVRPPRPIMQGLGAVRRKYINKNTLKSAGRMAGRLAVKGAGAALGGTGGLIATMVTGDSSNLVKYTLGGAMSGAMGAKYAGDKLWSGAKNVGGTFAEGAIGQEEYNNRKSDKEFYKSDEFKNMLNNYDLLPDEVGVGNNRTKRMKEAVQTYRDNGITDTSKISAAMQMGLTPQEGAYAIRLAENIGRSGWNNKNVRDDYEKRYRANIPSSISGSKIDGNKIWNSIEDLL